MRLCKATADIFVPDGAAVDQAIGRTTHLAVGAHQDDIEIMAYHGILECFYSADKWFTAVTCTNGAGSPRAGGYAAYSDEEMQTVRRAEQRQAAGIGHYAAMLQLNYSSTEMKNPACREVIQDLKNIISDARPEIIYTHNAADKHDTHVAVTAAVIKAVRELPREKRPAKLWGCEVWRNLDWLPDEQKIAMDLGANENLAAALLGVFDSQIAGGKRYDLATLGRRRANATYFQSHGVDDSSQMAFGMDLTPVVTDNSLDVTEYVCSYVENFKNDVRAKLKKLF